MYKNNYKAAVDYVDDQKRLNRIMYKKRIGTMTQDESRMVNLLKNRLAENPVAPLMESGMFANIIEDIKTTDLEKIGRVYKTLNKMGLISKFKKLPGWLQTGSSAIWRNFTLSNSSGLYRFMYGITQYSDFISKCTEYQIMMDKNYKIPVLDKNGKITGYKKVPDKFDKNNKLNPEWVKYETSVKGNVLDTFINYDRPQSRGEQYLNDLGLIMFSKFAKRIQRAIFTQSFLINTEDFMEQNVLDKHWKALIHNPIDSAITAGVPWGLQGMTGMIDLTPPITK